MSKSARKRPPSLPPEDPKLNLTQSSNKVDLDGILREESEMQKRYAYGERYSYGKELMKYILVKVSDILRMIFSRNKNNE